MKALKMPALLSGLLFALLVFAGANDARGQADQVRQLIQNENYSKAAAEATKLIGPKSKDGMLYYYKGLAYYKLANLPDQSKDKKSAYLEQAKTAFEAGMKNDRKNPYPLMGLAMYHAAKGQAADATATIEKAKLNIEEKVDHYVDLANVYFEVYKNEDIAKEKREAAMTEANVMLRKAEGVEESAKVLIALGDLYRVKGTEILPRTYYESAVAKEPENIYALFSLAEAKISDAQKAQVPEKRGELYRGAKDDLIKVTELQKDYAPAYKLLSDIYYQIGAYEESKKYAESWKNLLGDNTEANARYAVLLYLIGNYKDAAPALEKVRKDSSNIIFDRLLAYSHTENENYDAALKAFSEYFGKIKPENTIFKDYNYHAQAYAGAGQTDKAVETFMKALEKKPEEVTIYKTIAEMYKEKEDWNNYTKYLDLFLSKTENPTVRDRYFLAWYYNKKAENYEKADSVYNVLIKEFPDNFSFVQDRALLVAKMDTANAGLAYPNYVEVAKLALKQLKDPETPEADKKKIESGLYNAYNYLCIYHYKTEQEELSMAYCNKVLEMRPDAGTSQSAKSIVDGLKGQGKTPAPDEKLEVFGGPKPPAPKSEGASAE